MTETFSLLEPTIDPPQGGGDRYFTVLLRNIYCGGLCSPSATHTFLHCFPITSNQSLVCIPCYSLSKGGVPGVVSLFQTQDVFSR